MLEGSLCCTTLRRSCTPLDRCRGRMLWLLLCLLPAACEGRIEVLEVADKNRNSPVDVGVKTRPHIYFCRSPNMEDFSCWWHPLENLTEGEPVSYVLTYSKEKEPQQECPDYVSSGPNSCHFDSSHTTIWKMYCLNVTAVTAGGNYTSQQHCLDVADIVQTEAPVNLSFVLADTGGEEIGHNALLSWAYPVPSDLKYGWITLVYELQYRRVSEPDVWKVKHPLRDPHVELLGLPVGEFVVRVRCRSRNSGLWSEWSVQLLMSIPARPPAGKLLVLILVTGVGVVALLVITLGLLPQSKRIKDYFLPRIPKPQIIGIDPLLLKKGNLEEINRHFSNFHSYTPPSYTEEAWDAVSAGDAFLPAARVCSGPERDAVTVPIDMAPGAARLPALYLQSAAPPYCSSPPDAASSWLPPEILTLPGTEYSIMGNPHPPAPPPQDFYTCVQLMNDSGEVHLVPCLPPAYCREFPPPPGVKAEKKKKMADSHARTNVSDGGEAAVPLLPIHHQG
ncbi:prolactin receptor-like isoform X2 [Eleginops maclovinus]|uniref:prolactin receptor-like isoform X2 n=1 Tax=Eleginops maclovinus TaxID=56733 RepID=UPI00307FF4FD